MLQQSALTAKCPKPMFGTNVTAFLEIVFQNFK